MKHQTLPIDSIVIQNKGWRKHTVEENWIKHLRFFDVQLGFSLKSLFTCEILSGIFPCFLSLLLLLLFFFFCLFVFFLFVCFNCYDCFDHTMVVFSGNNKHINRHLQIIIYTNIATEKDNGIVCSKGVCNSHVSIVCERNF